MEPYAIFNVGFKSLKYLNGICDICNVAFIFFTKEVVFWLFWSLVWKAKYMQRMTAPNRFY